MFSLKAILVASSFLALATAQTDPTIIGNKYPLGDTTCGTVSDPIHAEECVNYMNYG
ncbi:uncharacterized protein LDX57_005199 [Aspergillus melleus]|uniref:uncharacterized protein n=1 Tax=Aspergillus melleus TaxID=138277 RepID=UPI001E8EF240|nr:uncharacterized protein LDX57_005199 [Aspergillus melleus]KAH8427486.1 hypothetical protein LDX57_005199 [Aspergillus melleus]